jgi:hypothetical protein
MATVNLCGRSGQCNTDEIRNNEGNLNIAHTSESKVSQLFIIARNLIKQYQDGGFIPSAKQYIRVEFIQYVSLLIYEYCESFSCEEFVSILIRELLWKSFVWGRWSGFFLQRLPGNAEKPLSYKKNRAFAS